MRVKTSVITSFQQKKETLGEGKSQGWSGTTGRDLLEFGLESNSTPKASS